MQIYASNCSSTLGEVMEATCSCDTSSVTSAAPAAEQSYLCAPECANGDVLGQQQGVCPGLKGGAQITPQTEGKKKFLIPELNYKYMGVWVSVYIMYIYICTYIYMCME